MSEQQRTSLLGRFVLSLLWLLSPQAHCLPTSADRSSSTRSVVITKRRPLTALVERLNSHLSSVQRY